MRAIHILPPKPAPNSRSNAGFTIVELLIGMAIFAIGSLAIAGLQTYSVNTNTNSRKSLEVETVVARIVENYKNLAWNDMDADGLIDNIDVTGDGTVDDLRLRDVNADGIGGINNIGGAADYTFSGSDPLVQDRDIYQFSVNIAPNVSVANSLTINVIAQWNHLGRTKTYNVLFLKARNV